MRKEACPYERQIFVCTNDRKGAKVSCGDHRGAEVFAQLRALAKERGFHPRVRVAQATCLGQCQRGVNVMVYPEQVWYSEVNLEDVPVIADEWLAENGAGTENR